jgi:hypothetical protein
MKQMIFLSFHLISKQKSLNEKRVIFFTWKSCKTDLVFHNILYAKPVHPTALYSTHSPRLHNSGCTCGNPEESGSDRFGL